MKEIKKIEWKEFKDNFSKADKSFQARLFKYDDEYIYGNIYEFLFKGNQRYQAEVQVAEEISLTGMTINICTFSYNELDFKRIEKDLKKIILKIIP